LNGGKYFVGLVWVSTKSHMKNFISVIARFFSSRIYLSPAQDQVHDGDTRTSPTAARWIVGLRSAVTYL
jgi:hypothetical protein